MDDTSTGADASTGTPMAGDSSTGGEPGDGTTGSAEESTGGAVASTGGGEAGDSSTTAEAGSSTGEAGGGSESGGSTGVEVAVTFAADVQPVLQGTCSCHFQGNPDAMGNVNMNEYDQVVERLDDMVAALGSGMMPPAPMGPLPDGERDDLLALLAAWEAAGTPEE